MKKKVFTIVSVVVVAVLYYFSISGLKGAENTNPIVSSTTQDIFTNTIFNTSFNEVVYWGKSGLHIAKNTDRYKELNFNAIHSYDGGNSLYGEQTGLLTGDQITNYKSLLDSINQKNLKGFYERSFIGKYAYGQRLIYEVSPTNNDTILNYGFVYKNKNG